MKCASADIRNHYIELMAARVHGLIQTQKKTTEFGANAKHSKNPKLLTVSHEEQRLFCASFVARSATFCEAAQWTRLVLHRLEDNARIRFLSAEEETRLRTVISVSCPEHLAELELALNTGVRLSEQYAIRWEDVSFIRRTLTIRRSKNGTTRHVNSGHDQTAGEGVSQAVPGRILQACCLDGWVEPRRGVLAPPQTNLDSLP